MISSYHTEAVSVNSIHIPDGVEVKSVSSGNYKPGTYKIVPQNKEVGTIIIYSDGHVTTLEPDGIHTEYPSFTLSSDSFYASNIKVSLQKQ